MTGPTHSPASDGEYLNGHAVNKPVTNEQPGVEDEDGLSPVMRLLLTVLLIVLTCVSFALTTRSPHASSWLFLIPLALILGAAYVSRGYRGGRKRRLRRSRPQ